MNIKNILRLTPEEQKITVNGWIRTKRDTGTLCFLEVNDGSCMANLQVLAEKGDVIADDIIDSLSTGASVEIEGVIVESPGKNQIMELRAEKIDLIGGSPADSYPLQKKRHSFEFLREIAHLRPRTNTFSAVSRVRSSMSYAVHKFFQERDFVYIHTPIITASDCEGAGEMFQVTTLPLNSENSETRGLDFKNDFFGKKAFLTVSGQLSAETYATALGNVYTFGPTFRAENSNTSRHLAEFWMIEPEMAFCNIEGNKEVAEEFLKYVLNYTLVNCHEDMAFFDSRIAKGTIETLEKVVESKFIHMTYTEAVDILGKSDKKFDFNVVWGCDLQSEHEKYLTEEVFKSPVIVTDYPSGIKAFYMKMNDDNKTVRGMDILVPKLGEIIGGSEREENYDKLLQRIKDANLNPDDYWWYLDLRKYGTVPHSGFGLGFERLIQYVTGMQNIRDVIPYPRSPKSADF